MEIVKNKCIPGNFEKFAQLVNPAVIEIVLDYVSLCNPKSIFVCTDSARDREYLRTQAVEKGEEIPLAKSGHTVHFDGYFDQARDKGATKYLVSPGEYFSKYINNIPKEEGRKEIRGLLKDSMAGKEMIVCFFCLGPLYSDFSRLALQVTDSYYVAHSEMILYRSAYEAFRKEKPDKFFTIIHSAGELEGAVSKNVSQRRVYIELKDNVVYSINTQYAGNTVGLKKLSLRLAIKEASQSGWLAEHMFVTGINGPGGRKTYFTGAFPSACGKTSTAMLPDETIVGDDIAFLREKNGGLYAVNTEEGMFGILQDVSKKNDPLIWDALLNSPEVIFSNVLLTKDGKVRWLGDGGPMPEKGMNFSGEWVCGKTDLQAKEIPYAHKNARYTVNLKVLENCDPAIDDPEGVNVKGIIYGGRDSSTWPPVFQSFDWTHGVITCGASLESEVTFATLDKEGERKFDPFSNLDFMAIPIGHYIKMHLEFEKKLTDPARIFAVNYFLRDEEGNFFNAKEDKHVWIKWMELRVHNDVQAYKTPIGYIPCYEDLNRLFREVVAKEYSKEDYLKQFTLYTQRLVTKIERIKNIYHGLIEIPSLLFDVLQEQRDRLDEAERQFGEVIAPDVFIKG